MSASHRPIAIVGNGIAGLIAFATLRFLGAPTAQIAVYGDHADPLTHLRAYTAAVRQRDMRSESGGHLLPTDFPGFATLLLIRRGAIWPWLAALLDAYHPALSDVLAQGDRLREQTGLAESHVPARVSRVERCDGHFALWDEDGQLLGEHQHILLAPGHPGLAWPSPVMAAWDDPALGQRVIHAYQPKTYQPGEIVAVLGAGLGAAHEWLNALAAGAQVVAVWRQPPLKQPLNAPRCLFNAAGLDDYRRLPSEGRLAVLRQIGLGSYPWRARWERQLWAARREGRLHEYTGELAAVRAEDGRLALELSPGTPLTVDRLVVAAGFVGVARAHPLVDRLVADYALPTCEGHLVVADDMTLPTLSQPDSVLAVSGMLARWAYPVADTFAGMKVAARAFAGQVLPPTRLGLRLANWWRLVTDRPLAA
jgi:hypothetical protein